jgi:hypothetical protein
MNMAADQAQKPGVMAKAKITKLENPIPEIILGDTVLLKYLGTDNATLTFSRGKKVFGVITIAKM